VTFWLGVVGTRVAARFADRIEGIGLRPKHVGLLAILDRDGPRSQQQLARELRVAPSLVVALADQLEELGAVRRERDPADRRRQNLAITGRGRNRLAECGAIAAEMDQELLIGLAAHQRVDLVDVLTYVADNDTRAHERL
jgi:DNA-binding MarR family transcriptional regulator